MSEFFADYHVAVRAARTKATELHMDVAVRVGKEYGKNGYHVSLASRNDSDYANAEIIHPGEPQTGF